MTVSAYLLTNENKFIKYCIVLYCDMNIFFLSLCYIKCANYHVDAHVVKMITEYAQLLSTAWHILDCDQAETLCNEGKIFKKSHIKHPSAIWIREHVNNYNYVVNLGLELCNVWRYRYNHPKDVKHGSEIKLEFLKKYIPPSINKRVIKKTVNNPLCFTLPVPQAMPEECKYKPKKKHFLCCIKAYRKYYLNNKIHLLKWTRTNKEYNKKDPLSQKRLDINKPCWINI